jgi:cytoskeleton-associated protein 5
MSHSEVYLFEGEKVWSLVGPLSPKDKTQLEERLRRVAGPSSPDKRESAKPESAATPQPSQLLRLSNNAARPASPSKALPRPGGAPRPGSPSTGVSRLSQPAARSISPASQIAKPTSHIPGPTSPPARGKSLLPSRLAAPRNRAGTLRTHLAADSAGAQSNGTKPTNGQSSKVESWRSAEALEDPDAPPDIGNNISLTISSILSSDSDRSVDALKKVQKILQLGPESGPSDPLYRDLAEHTEGLIETVTLQVSHAFDKPEENIRLAKHLIQTLNAFCDNPLLAESLTVDILTTLFEELALRLLQTDDSQDKEVKNLSRFINMIMLRLFSTGRRITVFRYAKFLNASAFRRSLTAIQRPVRSPSPDRPAFPSEWHDRRFSRGEGCGARTEVYMEASPEYSPRLDRSEARPYRALPGDRTLPTNCPAERVASPCY